MKRTVFLTTLQARQTAHRYVDEAPDEWVVTLQERTRTIDQNAKQWPYLQGFSQQLKWPVNCEMVYMTPDEWKDILTAAFWQETVRLAQGLNGGVVMIGKRTSSFSESKFREWMAFLKAEAANRGVEPVYANPLENP